MTEGAYEEDWLVRVRAQVMCRDEGTGGWVALGGGGLANVMVGKTRLVPSAGGSRSGESSNGEESGSRQTHAHAPRYEYFIYGKRISDQSVVLSCTIKKDFQYNKVMPTFHHWVTDEKRFGLTFQTAADARAFDKGVRTAIQQLLDGLGGAWPLSNEHKITDAAPREDDEENNIFECLNLPSDSRSSSENSTASRSHKRVITDAQTPVLSHIIQSRGNTDDSSSAASRELLMRQRPFASESTLRGPGDREVEDYSYVQLNAVHEYTYPQLGPGGVISAEASAASKLPPDKRDSGLIKKRGVNYNPSPPPLPDKKPTNPMTTFQARVKCRHCHEWYLESANRPGSCEYAPDRFRSCIGAVTCMECAQCMLYHCMADEEGEFARHPCSCVTRDENCTKRWAGISLLSLLVPCLWCYPPLACAHSLARACHVAGGRHAPHPATPLYPAL